MTLHVYFKTSFSCSTWSFLIFQKSKVVHSIQMERIAIYVYWIRSFPQALLCIILYDDWYTQGTMAYLFNTYPINLRIVRIGRGFMWTKTSFWETIGNLLHNWNPLYYLGINNKKLFNKVGIEKKQKVSDALFNKAIIVTIVGDTKSDGCPQRS